MVEFRLDKFEDSVEAIWCLFCDERAHRQTEGKVAAGRYDNLRILDFIRSAISKFEVRCLINLTRAQRYILTWFFISISNLRQASDFLGKFDESAVQWNFERSWRYIFSLFFLYENVISVSTKYCLVTIEGKLLIEQRGLIVYVVSKILLSSYRRFTKIHRCTMIDFSYFFLVFVKWDEISRRIQKK